MSIKNNQSVEQKFIACFLDKTRWNCNLNTMNLSNSQAWLKDKKMAGYYTTLIPFNMNIFPVFIKKIYVRYMLNSYFISRTQFTNSEII